MGRVDERERILPRHRGWILKRLADTSGEDRRQEPDEGTGERAGVDTSASRVQRARQHIHSGSESLLGVDRVGLHPCPECGGTDHSDDCSNDDEREQHGREKLDR
jgi:hypothetical protein